MELKGKISDFEILHEVVLDVLRIKCLFEEDEQFLKTLGKWYMGFLESESEFLSIKFPYFSESVKVVALEYVIYLDLLIKICNSKALETFEETELFDVFSYANDHDSYSRRKKEYSIPFNKTVNQSLLFGEDTIITRGKFVPIFKRGAVRSNKEAIYDAFRLFKVIAIKEVINFPVLIDVENDLSILLTRSNLLDRAKLLIRSFPSIKVSDDDERDEILDRLEGCQIKRSIIYKIPYQRNIDAIIANEIKDRGKQIEIDLRVRFCYDEISKQDLTLLPSELFEEVDVEKKITLPEYQVIDTKHDKSLYYNLSELQMLWKLANYNVYTTPFPAKWFMCINPHKRVDFWVNQFRKDYPIVNGRILEVINSVIEEIHKLDWISNYLISDKDTICFIPMSNSHTKVLDALEDFLLTKYRHVQPFRTPLFSSGSKPRQVIILDPFNKAALSNISESDAIDVKVIVPDFLYFFYQPYIKYFIAKYQFDALLEGQRSIIDKDFLSNKLIWEKTKPVLLNELKQQVRSYKRRYSDDLEADRSLEEDDIESNDTSNIEKNEDEVFESIIAKEINKRNVKGSIKVTVDNGRQYTFTMRSQVLLEENGYLVKTIAGLLNQGSRFLPIAEITKMVDRSYFAEKLASMSENAKNWKLLLYDLFESDPNVYSTMKKKGLSVAEQTFYSNYIDIEEVIQEDKISLPRSKRDWEIVCQQLSISEVDESWRCHKCKGDINRLKKAYSGIIQYLSESGNYGSNLDEEVIDKVASIFEDVTGIEEVEPERSIEAKSIIRMIIGQLELMEVSHIKILDNE